MIKVIGFVLLLGVGDVCAQQDVGDVVVGKPMPDITLNVEYVRVGKTTLQSLRGKPVVIDFFSKGCSACFGSFQKLNALYATLKDKMHFILIGIDQHDEVRQAYEKFRVKYDLQLPVAYDSILYKHWKINGVPHTIWIDPEGIVKAITSSPDESQLKAFSEGKPVAYADVTDANIIPFRSDKPFLVDGNGGDDGNFMQRSLLSEWKPGMKVYAPFPEPAADALEGTSSVQLLGCGLDDLYRMAYFGRAMPWFPTDTVAYGNYHYGVILEVNDSEPFTIDRNTGRNIYCYSLHRPEGGQPLRMIMQHDLQNFFGYDATVETRRFPYLALIAKPGTGNKLKPDLSKGPSKADQIAGGDFHNLPLSYILFIIAHVNQLVAKDLPLVDETGITGKVDLRLHAAMTDLEDVRQALRESGLDIIRKERMMKVIVIREGSSINKE